MKLHGADFVYSDFVDQKRLLGGRDVRAVVDAGANIGNTVAIYMDLFPQAQVYAFEPYPPIFEKLKQRFHDSRKVRLFKVALGACCEPGSLHMNEYADTNSLLTRPSNCRRYYAADNLPGGAIPVEVMTLDSFAQAQGLQHIDLLKLDVQGGEQNALVGAQSLLRQCQIDVIFSEVFFVPHYEGAPFFHELTGFLAGFGYSLFNICHLTRGQNGQLRFADAVYVSPELRRTVIDTYTDEA